MQTALSGFRDIAAKEFLHILRDPTTLVFALMLPLMQLILFGYAATADVRFGSIVLQNSLLRCGGAITESD